ncbi:MAG TPA: DNA methyltransferase [Verrucomicrobiae bacterium]
MPLRENIRQRLFDSNLELLPQMNEIYELELAFSETQNLDERALIARGAYFAAVDGVPTQHFHICAGESLYLPDGTARNRRRFFERNQFRTGYATHGLFPYRGKFHPQMVKGIINMMGLRPGEKVLDPMMGSGTTLVEASLMGIDSIGYDVSPFCQLMATAKLDGFEAPLEPLVIAVRESELLFRFFGSIVTGGVQLDGADKRRRPVGATEIASEYLEPKVWSLLLLAYMDSVGFAERSSRQAPNIQFRGILERYAAVVRKLQEARKTLALSVGHAQAEQGDARSLALPNSSIDGIVFSPPYSFAVDYVENDAPHLRLLRADLELLREQIVGLRGRSLRQKYDTYIGDMRLVLNECARVLKRERCCAIVIGTNSNQLGKVLGKSPELVEGLDVLMINLAKEGGLTFVRRFERRIVGLANSMRDEDILLFRKP